MKPSLLDENIFREFAQTHKLQPYKGKQIFFEIFKNQNINFADMTTLSKELRQALDKEFCVVPLEVKDIMEGEQTTKIWFTTADGHIIEAVILYHWDKHVDENGWKVQRDKGEKEILSDLSIPWNPCPSKLSRITLCISSQIGCPMNCLFCVTGKLGLKRNLTREEIIWQVLFANNYIKNKFGKKEDGTLYAVRNVVFMGMGEPLLNYENVKKSIEIMLDQNWLSLSRRHVTISTVGIIPGIQKLIQDSIPVKLAISLHAPNQKLRDQLMPVAQAYPLNELMKTIDEYVKATDNRIFYEYIMIKGVTDTQDLAKELAELLKWRLAHVNLIAYNENPAMKFQESDEKQIWKFKWILEKEGITVTVRDSLGREAKWACGQLGYENVDKNNSWWL